ncbi:MAG TPA: hypothetical protein VGD88_03535 [Opitutaceae bacterium]
MTPRTQNTHKSVISDWLARPKKKESTVIRIRGVGWFSLLKLLLVGYAFGSLPFMALLNYAAISTPGALSEEVKGAISLPAVLWVWPIAVFFAAWFTNFFVSFGLRIFGSVWPLEITVFIDEKRAPNQTPDPTAPSRRGSS